MALKPGMDGVLACHLESYAFRKARPPPKKEIAVLASRQYGAATRGRLTAAQSPLYEVWADALTAQLAKSGLSAEEHRLRVNPNRP